MLTVMGHLADEIHAPYSKAPARYCARQRATCLILLLCTVGTTFAIEPAGLMRGFSQGQIIIESARKGCTAIDVYIARSREQRAQGLMRVSGMDSHEGMLFIYSEKQVISMWMKNTLIPLDMLFANEQGVIVHLHRDAVPHDTSIISSAKAAALVLELNAGSIDAFGIAVGDRINIDAVPNNNLRPGS